MSTNRKTAIIVGTLFIIGTATGVLSAIILGPILGASDYLAKVAANQNQVIIGALLTLVMGLALAMVPLIMYPVLKKQNEALALGYVVFRGALETVILIALAVSFLLLVLLGQKFVSAGAPGTSYYQTLGALLLEGGDSINAIGEIVFPLGALMFYYLLYRSKLIPRWLSGWGFIAAILYVVEGLSHTFGSELAILFIPMMLQEMVMAVWLIVKGFNPSAIDESTEA